ncbi:MAG: hydrogenase large subunit [Acidimicrobiales bacterium]
MTLPTTVSRTAGLDPDRLADAVAGRIADGGRFAGLVARARPDGSTTLRALVAGRGHLDILEAVLAAGVTGYVALTPIVTAAAWYEREIHDLFGLEPRGHPRLDPLVLPLDTDRVRPRPGLAHGADMFEPDTRALPPLVAGEGMFTIPYGPVRSGVFESVEYLVETFGEDIPHLHTRVYHKHRGLDQRFGDLSLHDGVLLAERVEGTTSVAHAMAFSQALESLTGTEPPRAALLLRVVHAELERVANHLDSVIRHTEGAGQAVAYARMTLHKERILRLRSHLCGHRFGRSVVVPGGVTGPPRCTPLEALAQMGPVERAIADDSRALMATPSFIDRLRTTGVIPVELAGIHGALGPIGRGSGLPEDLRSERPYGAYQFLGFEGAEPAQEGDALARQRIRVEEIRSAFDLARQALSELADQPNGPWREDLSPADGSGVGWVEAPQGELIYILDIEDGRLSRVKARCPSFHNLAVFSHAFRGDIFTDFVFIEASFGLSVAGVAG